MLFRGGLEGAIRRKLIEENLLDAVIGLPAGLFYGTGIPACLLLFDRGRRREDVLFIDASREFADGRNQNSLGPQDIEKIVSTRRAFATVEKYAKRSTTEEIAANDYNLNIPHYVDTFEQDEEIDIAAVQAAIDRIEEELAQTRAEMRRYLAALPLPLAGRGAGAARGQTQPGGAGRGTGGVAADAEHRPLRRRGPPVQRGQHRRGH